MSKDIEIIREKFIELKPMYERLGENVRQALETFLDESNISYLAITYRIKDFESFAEKIKSKKYNNPFEDIEDICGLRIICYYQSDVERICEIIKKEFEIKESQDKEELLNADQFGYRSYHLIGKIKKDWLEAPNYRGLKDLKTEIQIRTILMHAWAEIEHKLAYKQKFHVPSHLKRKLFRISAKLEEADEQFEEIKIESKNYRESIISEAQRKDGQFDKDMRLDLDSFQAFLDFKFPNRNRDLEETRKLLDEILEAKISLEEILSGFEIVTPYLNSIEKEAFESKSTVKKQDGWAQVGIVRVILDLTVDRYYAKRSFPEFVLKRNEFWRKKITTKPKNK